MLDFLEHDEKVGRFWHRMVGDAASYPRFNDQAVGFEQVKGSLPVFFRVLGGDPGLELVANTPRHSNHRLTWRRRIGMEQERLDRAERHDERILLPSEIASFPDTGLNRQLAAFFTGGTPPGVDFQTGAVRPNDGLQAGLVALHRAFHVTRQVLASLPGFVATYADLAALALRLRPKRRPESHRLLPLLSDDKPHDIDHYDGRLGVEDTRRAVQEARHAGTAVFAITIDREASACPLPVRPGRYALVGQINRLVPALPAIYRQLVH